MPRNPRQKQARGRSRVGETFTAEVGPVAHGGHCIVRLSQPDETVADRPFETGREGPPQGPTPPRPPESRVVFVRHALPGETVVLQITEGTEGDRFWRADAVEVLSPSADRVPAPCPYAGPGLCGGCDFQHVSLAAQRRLKATVVREQLVRLARLDPDDPLLADLEVVPVPGDVDGLAWRTRVEYAVAPDGSRGMRRHRSRSVIPVERCLIAAPDAREVMGSGPAPIDERVDTSHGTRSFAVAADGFWQVHPGAPTVLVETVMELLDPQPGEKALDLYSGVGLFAAFLAARVGEAGRVVAVEGDRTACEHARANLAEHRHAKVEHGSVDRVLSSAYDEPFDLVVLDPPREGAKRAVVEQVVDRAPRAVAYVACDPAALARDVAIFAEHGYRMVALRSFDLFPMTHHVECVALFSRGV